ncbi:MAG: amidase [Polyangiales bacterium]
MDRRRFFALTAASGAALSVDACRPRAHHRAMPSSSSGAPGVVGDPAPHAELAESTIDEVARSMAAGHGSARALVDAFLARIDALDRRGPTLRSVLETNPDAQSIADESDAERREKGPRGPLHGVPILVKDNLDTADRMHTTAGSLALLDARPARDAAVVERLRAAGAVLLGKTNLSEWANFRSTRATSGWSGRGGQCKNPHVLDRSPSGSSSGTAAAIAAGLAVAGIGTETDGSILSPAATCGIVGLKPTVGLVGRGGIVPIAHSQDTAGPMARTVRDAALLLTAIAGPDPRDPATRSAEGHVDADYARFLDPNGLRGARIGVARKYVGTHSGVAAVNEAALETLRKAGAILVDPIELASTDYDAAELEVLLFEFKTDLEGYLRSLRETPVRTLAELVAWNERNAAREMPHFGQELFVRAAAKGGLDAPDYVAALAKCRRLSREEGIDAAIGAHRLDAIVAPTGQPAWVIDPLNGDHITFGSTTPAAVAGYPSITVPAGSLSELPIGVSFFGPAWSEGTLLRLAYAYEQASHARRPPRFLPTLALETAPR